MGIAINVPFVEQIVVGSYGHSVSAFANMGSSHRDTHIPDHSVYTDSHTIFLSILEQ